MAAITQETFRAWRAPRFGTENPTRMDNPLWASLVHDPINAYQVNKRYDYTRGEDRGVTWCFDRFGRSETPLDGGRVLHIAGEHEDYYDPDFYIYNDVIIVEPDGTVAIWGYPRAAFPPTDFHSATLVGDQVWIVGNLGYADARKAGVTQVCRLDLKTMAIEPVATSGDAPGWIHKHTAELEDGAIVVRGGKVHLDRATSLQENIDTWALDLATLAWTRRTKLDWQRWTVQRADERRSLLWDMRQLLWEVEHPDYNGSIKYRERLIEETGADPDLALVTGLYAFGDAQPVERDRDEYNVYRIVLDGVTVRFTEEGYGIAVMVEGRLAEERLHGLQQHLIGNLTTLHGTPWELEPVSL